MRIAKSAMGLMLVACGGTPISGSVVDGVGGGPLVGDPTAPQPLRVGAKAIGDGVSTSCGYAEAPLQADGTFSFALPCADVTYSLVLSDPERWLVDNAPIAPGSATTGLTRAAWPLPAGQGLYLLHDGKLDLLKTSADVRTNKILGGTDVVRSPSVIPDAPVLVSGADRIVLAGKGWTDLEFVPLIATGPRTFDDPASPTTIEPWSYLGVRFTTDTEVERVPAARPDPGKSVVQADEDHAVTYLAADALPPGRYAVMKEKDRRMYILDVGKRPEPVATPAVDDPAPAH